MFPRGHSGNREKDGSLNPSELLQRYLAECPLIAIIRGVTPDEAGPIGDAIYEGGIRIIEVPLNSPDPFGSIERLAKRFGERMLVGGGTVLSPDQVGEVRAAGGRLVVSPNTNIAVIAATIEAGMVSCPGYFTPTEAFGALDFGATTLKLFPAEAASPALLKAHLAVLPKGVPMMVVGGITPDNMKPWLEAGATGFGLGGGLYKPGQSAEHTLEKARAYVAGLK
jgi:2-dehydro-3-deoxyphosphogalactonate aldolase